MEPNSGEIPHLTVQNVSTGSGENHPLQQTSRKGVPIALLACALALQACTAGPPAPAGPVPTPAFHPTHETNAPLPDLTSLEVLNRLSWGATTGDAQEIAAKGLKSWISSQLHPGRDDGLPIEARTQIAAMEISQKSILEIALEVRNLQQQVQRLRGTPAEDQARKTYQQKLNSLAHEAAVRALLRDLYSKNQLKEQLTWFWFNHFNVYQAKGELRAFVGDFEETAIRPHVLGRFAELLAATALHPAMLQYLDNAQNAKEHINENYAREIMELHTLGVGSGYTQQDVQELARILTGLTVNQSANRLLRASEGRLSLPIALTVFNPSRHDFGDKLFLGARIQGRGTQEMAQALAMLAAAPQTAHFVSRELAQYFCCENPSKDLIDDMARSWLRTGGDIAEVLQTLFNSQEFAASLGERFKDPVHYALSAMRASYGDTVILNAQPLMNWLNRMGEPLYGHETPDGYPLTQASWSGPGEMAVRFEIAKLVGQGRSGLFKLSSDPGQEPVFYPDIKNTRYAQAVMPSMSPTTKAALSKAQSRAEWNLLFLSSPEFMKR